MGLQARTGWLLDTLPSEHSRRKPSWKKTSVRMFHCFTGLFHRISGWPTCGKASGLSKIVVCLIRKGKEARRFDANWKEKSNEKRAIPWAIPCSSYPFMSPWNHKSPVCVCACVSGFFRFGCLHTCTILYNICILYLCMHINIICYVMYVIFLRQQRHLLGSFLFVSASLVALEASKSSCSRESGMVWATNIHLRHRLKAVAIRWYTRNSIFASNFKGFSPFEPAFHVPHESDVVCAKPSWTNENAGRSTWIFTFSGIIF